MHQLAFLTYALSRDTTYKYIRWVLRRGRRPRPQNVVSMKLHEFYPTTTHDHDSASHPVSSSYIDMVMEDATSNIKSSTPTLRTTSPATSPTIPTPPSTATTSEAVEGILESVDSFEDLKVYVWELISRITVRLKKPEISRIVKLRLLKCIFQILELVKKCWK